jgi:tetratricopeptide (TPR) repeat protein
MHRNFSGNWELSGRTCDLREGEFMIFSRRRYCILIAVLLLIFSADTAFCATISFQRRYVYAAGEADSHVSAYAIGLEQAKSLLLPEMLEYLESRPGLKGINLSGEEMIALTAGTTWTTITEDDWKGRVYWFRVEITTDPDQAVKHIETLSKDRWRLSQLVQIRKNASILLRKIDRLRRELRTAQKEQYEQKLKEYNDTISRLSAVDWYEKGFRLEVSGQKLGTINGLTKTVDREHWRLSQLVQTGKNAPTSSRKIDQLREELSTAQGEQYEQKLKEYNEAVSRLSAVDSGKRFSLEASEQKLEAIEAFAKAVELNPKDAVAYYNQGLAFDELGKYEEALEEYHASIKLDPKLAISYVGRGNAYYKLKKYEKALKDYDKAIELKPEMPEPYVGRGNVYWKYNWYYKAIRDYDRAIELNPRYALAYYNRGWVYNDLGGYQPAIRDGWSFDAFNYKQPEIKKAWFSDREKDYDKAVRDGGVYKDTSYHLKAIRDYDKAIEVNPKYVNAYMARANSYRILGMYDKAIEDYNKVIELDPEYALAYNNRGISHEKMKRFQQAMKDYEKAAQLGSKESEQYLDYLKRIKGNEKEDWTPPTPPTTRWK